MRTQYSTGDPQLEGAAASVARSLHPNRPSAQRQPKTAPKNVLGAMSNSHCLKTHQFLVAAAGQGGKTSCSAAGRPLGAK